MRKYVAGTEAVFEEGALLLGEPELLPPAAITGTWAVRRRSAVIGADPLRCTFPSRLSRRVFITIELLFATQGEQRVKSNRIRPAFVLVAMHPSGAALAAAYC
jgi:hypothetical protein